MSFRELRIDVAPEDNPTNEPEPDAMVLKRPFVSFSSNPRTEDLHLVVEVADSILYFDLTTKASLYARAGLLDYWVLDVAGRRLVVHRDPAAGKYSSVVVYSANESVAPLAAPQAEFSIAAVGI